MVQYVITPWRDQEQLLSVRAALYPESATELDEAERQKAVALVSVWVQRGNCPHLIESTALLASAITNDRIENSPYAVRAAYSAAFCRFVTGLLDGYQEGKKKLSMYSIASNIGLSASFVELRHQCTHEELPSLSRLRAASRKSLSWLWENYWASLTSNRAISGQSRGSEDCRVVLKQYLRWRSSGQTRDAKKRAEFAERVKHFEEGLVLETLMDLGDSNDVSYLLQSTRLAKSIMTGEEVVEDEEASDVQADTESDDEGPAMSLDEIRAEMEKQKGLLEEVTSSEPDAEKTDDGGLTEDMHEKQNTGTGWEVWQGPWIPKPIGVV